MHMRTATLILACLLLLPGLTTNAQKLQAEERNVSRFSGISISVPGEVYIVQGDQQKLVVEGTERVLNDLITEVSGGQLKIYLPRWRSFRSRDELNIYLVVTDLNSINLSGSARMYTEGLLKARDLSVSISGSGRIEFEELQAQNLSTAISGSGRLSLGNGGRIESHRISISGSGRMESGNTPADKVQVTISGSGGCTVNVADDLRVRISGSGNVYYTGNPLVDSHISGSGRLISAN
jgi:hypothetical protein